MAGGPQGEEKALAGSDLHALVPDVFFIQLRYEAEIDARLPDGFPIAGIGKVIVRNITGDKLRWKEFPPSRPGNDDGELQLH